MIKNYRKTNPCPICGGYESAARGKGMRCLGFVSEDGETAWCSKVRSEGGRSYHTPWGKEVYRHPLIPGGDVSTSSSATKPKFLSPTKNNETGIPDSPETEDLNPILTITEELVRHDEVWLVVRRGTREITRVKESQRHLIRGWQREIDETS